MAMNKSTMATAMKNGMDAVDPAGYDLTTAPGVSAYRQALMEALADAIIKHIQSNAQIAIGTAFALGVPVPMDGGAALQVAWSAQPPLIGAIS